VGERGSELLELRPWQANRGERLHVDVAVKRIEVAERDGPEQPRAGETLPEMTLDSNRQLGQVGRDLRRPHTSADSTAPRVARRATANAWLAGTPVAGD
jgi:hypothetical protein